MKFYKIGFLFIILLIVITYFTFTGSIHREGLTFNDATLIQNIVFNTKSENASTSMTTICQMNIDDPDFLSIINSDLTDYQKILQLRALVTVLSQYKMPENALGNILDEEISLTAAINQMRNI